MVILGIETSCDETAAAVVEDGTKVLSSAVASSSEIHAKYGGIVPEMAAREQVKAIIPVVHEALDKGLGGSGCLDSLDAIAVTCGPGLIGSLIVGVETAKVLSWVWQKPLIPVNHLLAHIYGTFLVSCRDGAPVLRSFSVVGCPVSTTNEKKPEFPVVALIVSGGHTDLLLMKSHLDYQWLGGTRDDAAGEAFDKAARLLGLGYPGGPAIAKAAERVYICRETRTVSLPRPMISSRDLDFSFSGLKTALRRATGLPATPPGSSPPSQPSPPSAPSLAFEFQEAVTDVLVKKTISAGKKFKVKDLVLCGGVSANQRLREKMQYTAEKERFILHIPDFKYSTDNAAMVASRGYFASKAIAPEKLEPDPGLLFPKS